MNDNQNIGNTSNTNGINVVNNEIKTDFSDKKKDVKDVKLKRFNYKVKDASGKIVSEYFDAEKEQDVVAFLTQKGYNVVSITEDKLSTGLGLVSLSFSSKMNAKDLNFFLTQLSTYIKSGIPLVDSMEILSRQAKKRETRNLYKRIVFELNRGLSFSVCLEKQGKVFPKMLINMLRTSEMTGDLTGVLDDMAIHYKQQDSNRKQIISAMTYPSVLMVFAVAVLTFVLTYVVPSFSGMFADMGQDLPKITILVKNLSDFITNYWYYIIAVFLVVVIVLSLLYKGSKVAKYFMQSFAMHIPIVSNLIIYNQLVIFTSTFANLIKHDVFITDSMDILSKITENEIYKKLINNAINDLSKGNGVSPAFKGHWAFPDTAYEMLVTGEKTGKLGEMLFHVSEYYQEEQTNIISRMKSLIEPLMIIMLAVLVGIILLSVVVPMFDVYSGII